MNILIYNLTFILIIYFIYFMRKLILLFIFNTYYLNIYASENPLTNLLNDSALKVINEASELWWDDFKLTLILFTIIVSSISWLIIMFKKK